MNEQLDRLPFLDVDGTSSFLNFFHSRSLYVAKMTLAQRSLFSALFDDSLAERIRAGDVPLFAVETVVRGLRDRNIFFRHDERYHRLVMEFPSLYDQHMFQAKTATHIAALPKYVKILTLDRLSGDDCTHLKSLDSLESLTINVYRVDRRGQPSSSFDTGSLDELLGSPACRYLDSLSIDSTDEGLTSAILSHIVDLPITSLSISGILCSTVCRLLAANIGNVKVLELGGSIDCTDDFNSLLRSSSLVNLRELRLKTGEYDETLDIIASSSHLSSLQRLDISNYYLTMATYEKLVRSKVLAGLRIVRIWVISRRDLDRLNALYGTRCKVEGVNVT